MHAYCTLSLLFVHFSIQISKIHRLVEMKVLSFKPSVLFPSHSNFSLECTSLVFFRTSWSQRLKIYFIFRQLNFLFVFNPFKGANFFNKINIPVEMHVATVRSVALLAHAILVPTLTFHYKNRAKNLENYRYLRIFLPYTFKAC